MNNEYILFIHILCVYILKHAYLFPASICCTYENLPAIGDSIYVSTSSSTIIFVLLFSCVRFMHILADDSSACVVNKRPAF